MGRYLNSPWARPISLAEAVALVERVRASAERYARESLEALARAVPVPRVTLLIALGMLVAFLSFIVGVGMPGLQQRVFLCLVLLWLTVVVHQLVWLTSSKFNAVA